MVLSQQEVDVGATALENYVDSIKGRFIGHAVPQGTYEQGSHMILAVWDGNPHSADAVRTDTCAHTLYKVISDNGYGGQVTLAQCSVAATLVLKSGRKT